jgi:hypothetical protein
MDVGELKALALAIEPLSAAAEDPRSLEHFEAYNLLVSRFRERVTRALNNWTLGREIEPELTQELWLLAKALPGVRRRAEAAAQGEPSGLGLVGGVDES